MLAEGEGLIEAEGVGLTEALMELPPVSP